MSTFYAAALVDPIYRMNFPIFPVDPSSKEAVIEAVEAITHSNHTPEQIKGMLGAVKAKTKELFTDEEITNLFGDAEEAQEAFEIAIEKENFQLFYNYVSQTDPETKVIEYTAVGKEELIEKDQKISELTSSVESLTSELEAAKKALKEAPASEDTEVEELKTKVSDLTAELETKDATITSLKAAVALLKAAGHEALAKEAARLSIELCKPVAKNKTLSELTDLYAARTDESLKDTIDDLTLELSEGETSISGTVEPIKELDGALNDEPGVKVPDEDFVSELKNTITTQEEDVWSLWLGQDGNINGKKETEGEN